MTIEWLTASDLMAIHNEILVRSGGTEGVLDSGALESTVNRPINLHNYSGTVDPIELAASLGYGLLMNHCFLDGNKRIAFVGMATFLLLNGIDLTAPEADAAVFVLDMAASKEPADTAIAWLADWLKANTEELDE